MNFQPSKDKTTVVNYVTKNLRQAILNGTFEEGERLIQEDWANMLNVSRMPIREALAQLQSEGLVKIVPHKGAIVTPITKEDIEEIYHLRAYLEGLAVEKSLPFLTEEDKEELRETVERMEALQLSDETNDYYISLNERFHQLLRKGCPWKRVVNVVENFGISPIAPSLLADYYPETQREHRSIYEAAVRDDPAELRAAVEYHILRTKNNLIAYMAELETAKGQQMPK
ncbi:GntR family transcriptional regulator [Bacillus thermotolerans]|uniref:Transcriptional regulator, GntR family n=1 Tax=Bacillus thermotolerans TaxID=1221996 RepID=A0A0F5HZG9_BACTR|nr:GntR family transcriptional regulator [Bacillus thermotolerans]KKB38262.1 Transcriptional regulator, GntR family [Bacillus thermotolerans]KKB39808.1 Transcriptional regulator, GntR family [Bacillus thermotolerans]KKB44246.1 Transcriptional regulator, GntR family [Bacillus thermotolerans]